MQQEFPTLTGILQKKRFSESDILHLFESLAIQLNDCHSQGIPHGPLGTNTVILTSDGFKFSTIDADSPSNQGANTALISNFTRSRNSYSPEEVQNDLRALANVVEDARTSLQTKPPVAVPLWFMEILQQLNPPPDEQENQARSLGPALASIRKNFHKAAGMMDQEQNSAPVAADRSDSNPAPSALSNSTIINLAFIAIAALAWVFLRPTLMPYEIPVEGIPVTNLTMDVSSYWFNYFCYYAVLSALPVVILVALTNGLLTTVLAWLVCCALLLAASIAIFHSSAAIVMTKRFPSTDPYITTTCARIALEQTSLLGLLAPLGNPYSLVLNLGSWEIQQSGPKISMQNMWYHLLYFPYLLTASCFIWGRINLLGKFLLHAFGIAVLVTFVGTVLRFSGTAFYGSITVADHIFALRYDIFSIILAAIVVAYLCFLSIKRLDI